MSNENDEQNRAEVDLRTPEEWCQIERVQILDADGWRGRDGRPWTDPISLAEFQQRLVTCTQRSIPLPAPNTRRLAPCVKNWPDCESGQYNPACCRFPKSCSCTSYNPDTINDEDLEPMPTQPAGEHHTGTLDLTGEGNAPGSPISDATVEVGVAAWATAGAVASVQIRAALEAAYPAIRQQVAEEIAVALEAEALSDYDAADDLRWAAAKAREIGGHRPIGVHLTDVGVFVRCSCGKNPTPKYWIEQHWQGDRAEGERLVREMLESAREIEGEA